jgi:uncharacterized protein
VLKDPKEFCRRNEKLEGGVPVAGFPRLAALCSNPSDELKWWLEGSHSASGDIQLDLTVSGKLDLVCQRCLDTFSYSLDSKISLLLAATEEEADEMESRLADNDPVEVIVGGDSVNIMELIEDEVLLSIPLSPRHDACPNVPLDKLVKKPDSPFSALEGMKGRVRG